MSWSGLTPFHRVVQLAVPPDAPLEWDLHLILSHEYQQAIRKEGKLDDSMGERLLIASRPRFMWRAMLRYPGTDMAELLCDATDFSRSFPLNLAVWHHAGFALEIKKIFQAPQLRSWLAGIKTDRFWEFLEKSIEGPYHLPLTSCFVTSG